MPGFDSEIYWNIGYWIEFQNGIKYEQVYC